MATIKIKVDGEIYPFADVTITKIGRLTFFFLPKNEINTTQMVMYAVNKGIFFDVNCDYDGKYLVSVRTKNIERICD